MNPVLVRLFERGRHAYAYPNVRVTISPPPLGVPGIYLSHATKWSCVGSAGITDLALDSYHCRLLRSHAPLDRLLGCASTVYWGYFTRNARFAIWKANLLVAGASARPSFNTKISAAIANCNSFDWGKALCDLSGIGQLGRVPFASKVIAFLDPKNAGVYDNRINRLLADTPLGEAFFSNGAVPLDARRQMRRAGGSEPAIQARYQKWCLRLGQIRDGLNHHAPVSRWCCWVDRNETWRAVDVERAIFAFTAVDNHKMVCALKNAPGSPVRLSATERDNFVRRLTDFLIKQPQV